MRFLVTLTMILGLSIAHAECKKTKAKAEPEACETCAEPQDGQDFPLEAKSGECYVKVRRPAKFRTEKERVLVKEQSVRYEIVPAKFRDVEKKVLVKPESTRFEIIPAKFEKKIETVQTSPEFKRLSSTGAKFKSSKEKILVKPATAVWKKGTPPLSALQNVVSEVWCLVKEAAEYQSYTRQNVDARASVGEHVVDAESQDVETHVLVRPAEVKKIVEPAQYETVKTRELVSPAFSKEIVVQAEYKEVKRQVLVQAEEIVWQRVLCDTNLTPKVIRKIQDALKAKKYDYGKEKGKLTPATMKAIEKYQKDYKLSKGAITYEFLEHLKIEL